ncbi:MAG: HEAT repeat domain-containing protein [Akkermansiaceae bacterium]|nr:HEAT repeat domain-containing protein [Akkermansiaceae bacterium]
MNRFVLAGLLSLAAVTVRAGTEQDLIATLQSDASVPQKCEACQQLRLAGTAKSVPALAALLGEERTGHAARYALEGMPASEAGAALREALGKNSGLTKAGVIDSLGCRRDPEALPLLAPLLSDADATIAAATASALGKIGGKAAIAGLTSALDQVPSTVQVVVLEGLLQCAERLLSDGDRSGAAAIYRDLFATKFPGQIRTAAWRGLAISDAGQRTDLVVNALAGTDRPVQAAALKLVRELADTQVIKACLGQWASLSAESQLAVLDAHVKLGAESLATVRTASGSPHLAVRVAAWQALADLSELAFLPALAKAAARGEPAEREAARGSLARLRGPGSREALLACLDHAEVPEKTELLRVLGERGDTAAANVLVQNAGSESAPVRLAALASLRRLAVADTLAPLLDLAAKARSDAAFEPVLKALYAVCQASPDKVATARCVVESIGRFPVTGRRRVLPLLAELGTSDALAAAQTATRDNHPELAKDAIRVLAQWPNATPASYLLELAGTSADATMRTLALRACIGVVGQEPDLSKRLAMLQQASAAARNADEKKQALGQLGQVPMPEALEVVLKDLADRDLVNEAAHAAVNIAEMLASSNPKLADEVAVKVLAQVKEGNLVERARALRITPSSAASFIRDWVVCGPYRRAGATGAEGVFNVPFGPENAGEKVEWKTAPRTDHINLMDLFGEQASCAAYLRAQIIALTDCSGALLMGSDDGIKAWLNGEVVHSHNIDRGEVADEDTAPIKLKKGTNELILKITQGGGGWSACARIVGADGKPIPGLLVQRPGGAAAPVGTPAS